MTRGAAFFNIFRRILKLHEATLKPVCEAYGLSLIEANILSFLCNNPEQDTASDIAELRMLSKGNVSTAIESLTQKGLLSRTVDPDDRRKQHLRLTPAAEPITEDILLRNRELASLLFEGFDEAMLSDFLMMNQRIVDNLSRAETLRM